MGCQGFISGCRHPGRYSAFATQRLSWLGGCCCNEQKELILPQGVQPAGPGLLLRNWGEGNRDGVGLDGLGWDGIGWDEMGWFGMGWDRMECLSGLCSSDPQQ